MLQRDFRRAFDYIRTELVDFRQRRRRHRAGYANLRLTAAFRAADGGVLLDHIADDPRHGKRVQNLALAYTAVGLHVVEHGGHNAGGAAGRRGHHHAVCRILFGCRQRIGGDTAVFVHQCGLKLRVLVIERLRLARERQPAGQHAALCQPAFHAVAHRRPHGAQMVVNVRFVVPHIVRQRHVVCLDKSLDFVKIPLRIDLAALRERHAVDHHAAAAHRKRGEQFFGIFTVHGAEVELIRVRKIGLFRVENDLGVRAQHLAQHAVGAVPAPGHGKRAEQHDAVVPPPIDGKRVFRDALRPDGVRAGRPAPDAIQFFQGFHGDASCCFLL